MDLFYEITWEYSEDGREYEKMIENERVFDFLHGLNSDLDEVRGILLGTKPFPSIKEAFAKVRREESRKKVMLTASGSSNNDVYIETSTLVTSQMKTPNTPRGESQKDKQWCDYCNKPYHTREICWKIYGKLVNWKPKNQRRGNQSTYVVEAEAGKPTNLTLSAD